MVKVGRQHERENKNRFHGLTNNGASRGDARRLLRRLYTEHGITPSADLGTIPPRTIVTTVLPREGFAKGPIIHIGELPEGRRKKKRHNGRGRQS